jgi:hypothetical protein
MDPAHGFNLLFVALCEVGLALRISRIVSNFEACMSRVYRDLPLVFHPATTGAPWSFTPIAVVRCRAKPAGVWYPRAE